MLRNLCFFSDAINATCSSRCWEYSCWGPSEDQCVRCPRYRHNVTRVCLTSCDEEPRLYADDSAPQKQCQPCDPLCLNNCTGPVTATLCLQKSSPTLFLWLPGAVQRGAEAGRAPSKDSAPCGPSMKFMMKHNLPLVRGGSHGNIGPCSQLQLWPPTAPPKCKPQNRHWWLLGQMLTDFNNIR